VLKKTESGPATEAHERWKVELERAGREAEARWEAARDVTKVFKRLGLDIKQPADWERLRAVVLETRKPKRGAPEKWSRDSLLTLGFAWEAVNRWCVVHGEPPPKTMTKAAALILKRFPRFKQTTNNDRALARRLPKAIKTLERRLDFWRRHPRLAERVDRALERHEQTTKNSF
jgi:hypothetical protein